jgi:hypothetical protein
MIQISKKNPLNETNELISYEKSIFTNYHFASCFLGIM